MGEPLTDDERDALVARLDRKGVETRQETTGGRPRLVSFACEESEESEESSTLPDLDTLRKETTR